MPIDPTLTALVEYTGWERAKWHEWLRQQGAAVLQMSAGPHGDGRFARVGELLKHIFSAEKRYIERLTGRPLTDTAALPDGDLETLFDFGRRSRTELKAFLESFPAKDWDAAHQFTILNRAFSATPRKIVIHVLTHEIRHWAQIATLLRLNGLAGDCHDFLFSPVLDGGEFVTGL